MADSDEDYGEEISEDEHLTDNRRGQGYSTRSSRRDVAGQNSRQSGRAKERWEDIQRSWDLVTEGADGSLAETVEVIVEAGKRKRLLRDTTPLQRGIIRHVVLVIDMSISMSEKDLRPTRHLLSVRHAITFVREFFEQNPISQLGILAMFEGIGMRVSDMSGNPNDHITALQKLRTKEPKGNPSLQNALDMARGALFHTPSHGTREVLIIFGALLSSDPGDIHKTIRSLVADSIRVSIVGLAARIAICSELVSRTNGLVNSTAEVVNNYYGVAINEMHFRDLLLAHTTPPPVHPNTGKSSSSTNPSLLMMGFPSRTEEASATLCLCHSRPSRGGYLCSRCKAKVCSLPAQCPVCDLQLIQSTHLARSYHHLFPLRNYEEVSWNDARQYFSTATSAEGEKIGGHCFACLTLFPAIPRPDGEEDNEEDEGPTGGNRRQSSSIKQKRKKRLQKGASESSRYVCTSCGRHFCIDCDVFAHEISHNCAGCLCMPILQTNGQEDLEGVNGDAAVPNGITHGGSGNFDSPAQTNGIVSNGPGESEDVEMT